MCSWLQLPFKIKKAFLLVDEQNQYGWILEALIHYWIRNFSKLVLRIINNIRLWFHVLNCARRLLYVLKIRMAFNEIIETWTAVTFESIFYPQKLRGNCRFRFILALWIAQTYWIIKIEKIRWAIIGKTVFAKGLH